MLVSFLIQDGDSPTSSPDVLCRKARVRKITRISCPKVLSRTLLFAALPRVCLIVLEFCQPFLITYAIKYVTQATVETFGVDIGYQLILASIFIYTGLAVSLLASPRVQSLIDLRLPQHRTSIVSIVYAQCSEVLWSRLSTHAA